MSDVRQISAWGNKGENRFSPGDLTAYERGFLPDKDRILLVKRIKADLADGGGVRGRRCLEQGRRSGNRHG